MNTKLIVVVKTPYIYHGWSTWKMFWEEKFTPANMKNCGRRNVRRQREVKDDEKYITLDISYDFGSL